MTSKALEVKREIERGKNCISRIDFIKKSNGKLRSLYGRLHVHKNVIGVKDFTKQDNKNSILRIFDMDKNGWRSFDLNTVIKTKVRGIVCHW